MSNTSLESVWLQNPRGVKVALPPKLAAERLKQAGWNRCEPEVVPATKQYPMDGELTEEGEKRRAHRQERMTTPIAPTPAEPDPAPEAQAPRQAADLTKLLTPAQYRELPWNELRAYAQVRGVDLMQPGMTKEKILQTLDASAGA